MTPIPMNTTDEFGQETLSAKEKAVHSEGALTSPPSAPPRRHLSSSPLRVSSLGLRRQELGVVEMMQSPKIVSKAAGSPLMLISSFIVRGQQQRAIFLLNSCKNHGDDDDEAVQSEECPMGGYKLPADSLHFTLTRTAAAAAAPVHVRATTEGGIGFIHAASDDEDRAEVGESSDHHHHHHHHHHHSRRVQGNGSASLPCRIETDLHISPGPGESGEDGDAIALDDRDDARGECSCAGLYLVSCSLPHAPGNSTVNEAASTAKTAIRRGNTPGAYADRTPVPGHFSLTQRRRPNDNNNDKKKKKKKEKKTNSKRTQGDRGGEGGASNHGDNDGEIIAIWDNLLPLQYGSVVTQGAPFHHRHAAAGHSATQRAHTAAICTAFNPKYNRRAEVFGWLDYHKKQGFAHFYIYLWGYNDDDASPDDVDNGDSRSSGNHAQEDSAHRRLRLFLRDIAEWEKAGYVTVIPWTRQFGGNFECNLDSSHNWDSIYRARDAGYSWLANSHVDEFLRPGRDYVSVQQLLEAAEDKIDAIAAYEYHWVEYEETDEEALDTNPMCVLRVC